MRFHPRIVLAVLLPLLGCEPIFTKPFPDELKRVVISGDQQTGEPSTLLAEPLRIRLLSAAGASERNHLITFQVTEGEGRVRTGSVRTDADGWAQDRWTVGSVPGEPQRVEAWAIDAESGAKQLLVIFTATVVAGPPVVMTRHTMAHRTVMQEEAISALPSVRLQDRYGNPTPHVPVLFTSRRGRLLGGESTTDVNGVARVSMWTLGTDLITDTVEVSAGASVITGNPTLFTATVVSCHCWLAKPSLQVPRFGHASATFDGKLYVFGGQEIFSRASLRSVERFDPVTNKWSFVGDMPAPRVGGAAVTIGRTIYLVGGNDYDVSLQAYDPVSDTWAEKAAIPTGRSNLGVAVVDGVLYAIGGYTGFPVTYFAVVEAYDPATDTWTQKASMPTPRNGLGVAVVNGIIYAVGGFSITNHTLVNWLATVEAYDPATDTWTTKASMPTARSDLGVTAAQGFVYAVGGHAGGLTYRAEFEVYDPATDTWSTLPPDPTPRYRLEANELGGSIYTIGGFNHHLNGVHSFVEAYLP